MVSILLGALLLIGIIQSYSDNLQGNNLQRAFARVQESGRFAVEILAQDIRRADFWGCLSNNTNLTIENNLDITHADYASVAEPIVEAFEQGGLLGQDNVPAGTQIDGEEVLENSDTITLIGASGENSIQVVKPYMNTNSAALHVSTGNGIKKGDILLVTDCTGGDIFEVTSANPDTSGQVTHNTGTVTTVGNGDQEFSHTYAGDAGIQRLRQITYFIGTGFNGRPALFSSSDGTVAEIASNVENMEILYGEDTNGNQVVDQYVTADAVGDMESVLSVRVNLLVASEETNFNDANTTFTLNGIDYGDDGRLRKLYSVVTNIRNRISG